jgi:hypothetical protein
LSLVKLNHVTESAINELTQIAIMQENKGKYFLTISNAQGGPGWLKELGS